jgi:hypothetical protein
MIAAPVMENHIDWGNKTVDLEVFFRNRQAA